MWRSGASGSDVPGAGRPGAAAARTASRSTQVMDATADALDAGLLQYSDGAVIGTGRLRRDRRTSGSGPPRLPIITPEDLAQVHGGRAATGKRCGSATSRTSWRTTSRSIGDAVINGGPGLMLIVEKFPWANTLDVTQASRRRSTNCSPGLPGHRDRHHDLPAGRLHRAGDRQPHPALLARLPARGPDPRRLPVRVAHRADQPGRHPAVAGGRGARALLVRARRSTRWCWPGS